MARVMLAALLASLAAGSAATSATAAIAAAGMSLRAPPPPLFPKIVADVPGRTPSSDFTAEVFDGAAWTPVYVWGSSSGAAASSGENTTGYFAHLSNWTVSWVSSQLPSGALPSLQLRVRRAGSGPPIRTATTHPASASARVANVSGGAVTLVATASARVAVDMDGALDMTDTGPSYTGPPVATFVWFVDGAPSAGLPDPQAPNTIIVRPGDPLPNASSLDPSTNQTVIFAPGVHRASPGGAAAPYNWSVLTLAPNTRYFLCAGSVVHAAFSGMTSQANVRIDGFGVMSGEEMARGGALNISPVGIQTGLNANTTIEGVTLVDFPNHHLILGSSGEDDAGAPNVNSIANVKVLGWRANGDGLHVFRNWTVRDLFLRSQDDSMYLACGENCTTTFTGVTTWNDANGCAFIFTAGGGAAEQVQLRDSDVIYARASWAWWSGGRIFCQRGATVGGVMAGVLIDGVRVEDRLPSLNAFELDMTGDGAPTHDAVFSDVTFRNVAIANWSTVRETLDGRPLPFGLPNLLFAAGPQVVFRTVAFENVTIAGERMGDSVGSADKWNISGSPTLDNVTVDGVPLMTTRR
jgi:hypothetical protein